MRKLTRDQRLDERSIDLYSRGRHLSRHYLSRHHRIHFIEERQYLGERREKMPRNMAKIGLPELETRVGRAELPDAPGKFAIWKSDASMHSLENSNRELPYER